MTRHRNEHNAQAASSPCEHTSRIASPSAQPVIALPPLISLPRLLQQPLAEPDWIVPGLLPAGVSLLAAPARVDKALLANQLGLSVATGQPFLRHFPVRRGRVLYLSLAESSVHVRGRAVSLLNNQHSPEAFHLAFQWSPFRQGGLADLEDTLATLEGTRLVIVDPLERVQPLRSENSSARKGQGGPPEAALTFFIPLRELATRYHAAILLLHHLPDEWPYTSRDPLAGHSPTGLTAASDCNLLLTSRTSSHSCELHLAGVHVAERRLHLVYEQTWGEWKEE